MCLDRTMLFFQTMETGVSFLDPGPLAVLFLEATTWAWRFGVALEASLGLGRGGGL